MDDDPVCGGRGRCFVRNSFWSHRRVWRDGHCEEVEHSGRWVEAVWFDDAQYGDLPHFARGSYCCERAVTM